MKQVLQTAATAALIILLVSCSTPPLDKTGEAHPTAGRLFRHRWWNYYIRGLASADRMDYAAALADLERAIAQRAADQRMARTYGMHFIDYFPHRERGVIHWLRQDLQAARTELERSIAHYPSAKAHYYLDRVRQALIKRRKGEVPPPQLELDPPSDQWWTRDDPIRLSGHVRDPNFVARVTVNGIPIFMEGAMDRLDFEQQLRLSQGRHSVTVTAANLAERTISRKVHICVDRQGPWLVVEHIAVQKNHTLFQGMLFDEAGTASVAVNHTLIPITPGRQTALSFKLPADQPSLTIEARDRLGNTTTVRLASYQWQGMRTSAPLLAGLQNGPALAGLFSARDTSPPLIRIPDWDASQTVYLDQVVLTGSVHDKGKVVSLRINDQDVLPRIGPIVFFSHFVMLKTGPNPITIESRDAQGNRTVKQITIVRKIPKALLHSERLRMGVLPFELRGEIAAAGFALQDSFIHQLVQRQRFQVVEREKLDVILQEQKLGGSSLIDTPTAVRLGRLAAAHAMVAGTVIATRTGTEVIGRVIDSETAEILTTVDVYSETHSLLGYKEMAQSLALKIHREFPLVDGRIIDKQGPIVFIDLGRPKLRVQRRIIIYQDRPLSEPDAGRFVGYDHQVLGEARVIQYGSEHSKAQLQPGHHPQIQPQQKVITQ
jgi:hypothetical protein